MLSTGQVLGAYRVISHLGSGGLGGVYLAEDTRLGRRVALKVLPADTAGDETSRKRLVREARAAAALDHPNICAVFDVGEAEGRTFIAMQYVEGQALSDRIAQRPLDLAASLDVGTQLAAALGEAHQHGIVHRDIKPQNMIIGPSGHLKILDFGLAKPVAAPAGDTATATVLTESGVVSGTAPYMSPEQVRGEPLDARSDVFSAGVVLYELLGRARPFAAASAADTMLAILSHDPPPLTEAMAPAEVQRIIRKCLEKDREHRYQSAKDLAIDLANARRALDPIRRPDAAPQSATPSPTSLARRRRRWIAGAVAAGAILAAVAAMAVWRATRTLVPSGPVPAADFTAITDLADSAVAPVLSPDGRMVAFIRGSSWFLSTGDVYVKLLPDGEATRLTNDPRPKYGPAFSPDGTHVAYSVFDPAGWETWTVPVLGGAATRLLPNAAGLSWIDPDHVLFSEVDRGMHMGIVTATGDRGDERAIYFPTQDRGMAHGSWLSPDRRQLLVVEMDHSAIFQRCRLLPFDGRSPGVQVGPNGRCTGAAWSPDGQWMYFSAYVDGASHLWRQRNPASPAEPVTTGTATEEEGVAVAPDGRSLITSVGRTLGSLWLHDPDGERRVPLEGSVQYAILTSDGGHAYCLARRAAEPVPHGVTRVDLASGKSERLLTDFAIGQFDVSADERWLAFTAVGAHGEREIWVAPADRHDPPRRLAESADSALFTGGADLVFRSLEGRLTFLERINLDGTGRARLLERPINELVGASPADRAALVLAPKAAPASLGVDTLVIDVPTKNTSTLCADVCRGFWSRDGRTLYLERGLGDAAIAVPVPAGRALPRLTGAVVGWSDWSTAPGSHPMAHGYVQPGPNPSTYLFLTAGATRNLYRVPLVH